jgi:hypothetical protein
VGLRWRCGGLGRSAVSVAVGSRPLGFVDWFQLAEVAVPHALFAAILRRIDRLRGPPVTVA